jgi:hypothetical protein
MVAWGCDKMTQSYLGVGTWWLGSHIRHWHGMWACVLWLWAKLMFLCVPQAKFHSITVRSWTTFLDVVYTYVTNTNYIYIWLKYDFKVLCFIKWHSHIHALDIFDLWVRFMIHCCVDEKRTSQFSWGMIMYRRRAYTQVLFLRKAELGFFHFLEIVTGWLVPSDVLENPSTGSLVPSTVEGPACWKQVSSGR